jgi:Ca2+-binding RTX toxin-like protein
MFGLFQFRQFGIDEIDLTNPNIPRVTNNDLGPLNLYYSGSGFAASGVNPTAGTFTSVDVYIGAVWMGTLASISPVGDFSEIATNNAYKVLNGSDSLNGHALDDTLIGGFGGNDTFNGFAGDDEFIVGARSGAPTHTFNGSTGTDTVTVTNNIFTAAPQLDLRNATFSSIEELLVNPGIKVLINASQFGAGLSLFANLAVTSGPQTAAIHIFKTTAATLDLRNISGEGIELTVEGNAGVDTIFGSAFGETILGLAGNDVLNAGPGADLIRGGLGADTLAGGPGADRFDFDSRQEIGKKKNSHDIITDFEKGIDKIDLSTIDANGSKKGDKAFKFLKKEGAAFTKAGQLGFDQKKGATFVQGDIDGNGKADFRLELTGLYDLTKSDFIL